MPKYQQPRPAESILANIKRIYANVDLAADQLQFFVVALLRKSSEMSKKDIMDESGEVFETLTYLFKNSPKGMDRGTMSAWWVAYSPIRPRFNKGNGHYEGFAFARKGTWDVEGATANPWYAEDPEATRQLKAPELEKQIARLMQEAAKLAAVTNQSVTDVADLIKTGVANAESAIAEKLTDEKVVAFADAYAAQSAAEAGVSVH